MVISIVESDLAKGGLHELRAVVGVDGVPIGVVKTNQDSGLTLAQIREVIDIRDGGDAPCLHVYELLTARVVDIDRQIADVEVLRAALIHRRDQGDTADPSTCPADTVCRYV